ncbi:MAG: hypothetical protein M1370_11445 [Bacteroidetes bacterium]|nr:hypothetical protein [Bacteroidota bacterium]
MLDLAEDPRHLFGTSQVEILGLHPHPVGIVHGGVGLDAEQDLLGVGVLLADVVDVVGGDHRNAHSAAQLQHAAVDLNLVGEAVVLDLQVVAVRAHQVAVEGGGPRRGVQVVPQDGASHLAGWAAGGDDQALVVLLEQLVVDARLVVEPLQLGLADQIHEGLVAGEVLGQQKQVRGAFVLGLPVVHAALGHVGLDTDERLYARGLGGQVKLDGAVHGAVVGEGKGRHAELFGPAHQVLNLPQSVQQ